MKPFSYYLDQCKITDTSVFTEVLKLLGRERGGRWIKISMADAEYVYNNCLTILVEAPKEVQFNVLRLIRYCLSNEDFLKRYYPEIWELYGLSIFYPDGNVRNAGLWLYAEYLFQISCLLDVHTSNKELVKVEEFYVFSGMSLFKLHNDYIEGNKLRLTKKDRGDGKSIPFASDTKDPYLRTIRRGIEELTRGTLFDKLAKKYGFKKVDL